MQGEHESQPSGRHIPQGSRAITWSGCRFVSTSTSSNSEVVTLGPTGAGSSYRRALEAVPPRPPLSVLINERTSPGLLTKRRALGLIARNPSFPNDRFRGTVVR